jgi:hypothetical protein
MARQYATPKFEIGDKIAYSVQFLKSIGMSHSDMARARGKITNFMPLGESTLLASITWDRGEFPGKVNVENLAKVGPNPRFCNVD